MTNFSSEDYWKGIILYGLNAATYKMALAKTLLQFAEKGVTHIEWRELSERYFSLYQDRITQTNRPQQGNASRLTKMERYVAALEQGHLNHSQVIELVAENAFVDVVPRFQTIGTNKEIAASKFYEIEFGKQLILTDSILELGQNNPEALYEEIDARWGLLEGAFQISQSQEQLKLANDVREIYLAKAVKRASLTTCIPFLQGYQGNICFYCCNPLDNDIHVDHVLPRQVLQHDQIWNLVLSHSLCNMNKSDKVVRENLIEKLEFRNENIMGSNHPWKSKISEELGNTRAKRRQSLRKHYENVKTVLGLNYWDCPEVHAGQQTHDPFYSRLITKINNRP
jgi:hypothetical protein